MEEQKTVQDKIKNLLTHPDWPLVEGMIREKIIRLQTEQESEKSSNQVIARNVISRQRAISILSEFLEEIVGLKGDNEFNRETKSYR